MCLIFFCWLTLQESCSPPTVDSAADGDSFEQQITESGGGGGGGRQWSSLKSSSSLPPHREEERERTKSLPPNTSTTHSTSFWPLLHQNEHFNRDDP